MNDETNDNVIEEAEEVEKESSSEAPKKGNFALYIFIFALVIAVVIYLINSNTKVSDQKVTSTNTPTTEEQKVYTLTDISGHKSAADCWTTINGDVFDLTKFVSKHKGGDKILAACGVDATDYFTGKHPTIGRVHSELAVKLLSSMKIGTLQK